MEQLKNIFAEQKKQIDDTLENIDIHPEMFQDGAKYFWLGQKNQLLIIEKKIANVFSSNNMLADSSNCCEECSKKLESGTVFCSADCRRHYYSN